MDNERLLKANKLKTEMETTQKMINALNAHYVKSINAVNYLRDKESTEVFIFESNSKLHEIILNYFENIFIEQQKEFDEL